MFKKSSLIFVLVLCFWQVNAQFAKGDKFVGGSVSFSTTTVDQESSNPNQFGTNFPNKTFNLSIRPQISFFVSDNIALGVGVGYNRLRTEFKSTFSNFPIGTERVTIINTTQSYELLPSFRYYWKLADRAGVFFAIDGSVGKGTAKTDFEGNINVVGGNDDKIFQLGIDLSPRFYYFITKRLNIEASFGGIFYNYEELRQDSGFNEFKTDTSNLGVNFANTFTLSFNYFFGKSFKKQ